MDQTLGRHHGRDALSTPEIAVLVGGPKVGDEVVVKLAFKELVARGHLALAVGVEPRRFGPVHRTPVVTEGARPGPVGNPVLDAVLGVVQQSRPPVDMESLIAEAVQSAVSSAVGLGKVLAAARAEGETVWECRKTPETLTYSNGVVGTPVEQAAGALFRRHPPSEWHNSSNTHGFTWPVVLPPLIERGLVDRDRRLTPRGKTARAELAERLAIRWRRRAGAAIAADLLATAPDPDLRAAFSAIDRAVGRAHNSVYGD